MKIKAVILAFIFLLGGSGFSVDVAKCCSKISGISIGFGSSDNSESKGCCARIKPVKSKSCCTDMVFQTVINPVLGLSSITKPVLKANFKLIATYTAQSIILDFPAVQPDSYYEEFDHQYPVPILIRKRVLQI